MRNGVICGKSYWTKVVENNFVGREIIFLSRNVFDGPEIFHYQYYSTEIFFLIFTDWEFFSRLRIIILILSIENFFVDRVSCRSRIFRLIEKWQGWKTSAHAWCKHVDVVVGEFFDRLINEMSAYFKVCIRGHVLPFRLECKHAFWK